MEGVSQQTLSPWHASDRDGLLPLGWGKPWVVSSYDLSSPKSDPDAEGVFGDGHENSQIIDKDCIIKNIWVLFCKKC